MYRLQLYIVRRSYDEHDVSFVIQLEEGQASSQPKMQKLSIVKKESVGNPGKKDGAGVAAEKDGAGDKKAKTGEVSTLKKRSVAFVPTGHTMDNKDGNA
jgi:hypothetical protein